MMTGDLGFDESKHYLGKLCPRSHEWRETGKTLRRKTKGKCAGCCIECDKLTTKTYRKRFPEKERARQRARSEKKKEWYGNNRDKVIARVRRNYRENKARILLRGREYYRRNASRIKIRTKNYRSRPEVRQRSLFWQFSRREKLKQVHRVGCTLAQVDTRFAEFENRCAYCLSPENLTVDHFIPIDRGGSDCLGNYVPACKSCNSSKHNKDPLDWYKQQESYTLERWRNILKVLGKREESYNQIPLF